VTALLSIPFLGEVMLPAQWIGSLRVLAGIYVVHHSRQAHAESLGEEIALT
jgi:drug/metabolite transporter (DMT)-like permease